MPSWPSGEWIDVPAWELGAGRAAAIFCLLLQLVAPTWAETLPETDNAGWTGAAGIGPIVFPRYTGGKSSQTWLIPLISADYNNLLYIEPLRAGVYAWGSEDRKLGVGLAIEPRLGFKASDGPRLTGMNKRGNSLEGGLAVDWDFGLASLSMSLFTDMTHSSGGESARLYLYREIVKNETVKLGVFGGIDWMSKRVSNYFFGVGEWEENTFRQTFHPGSAINATAGFDGHYRLSRDYSVIFGAQLSQLGHAVAESPIVESQHSFVGWLGMAWNL